MDTVTFRALGANSEEAMLLRLNQELDVIAAFATFIVFAPSNHDNKSPTNSETYA